MPNIPKREGSLLRFQRQLGWIAVCAVLVLALGSSAFASTTKRSAAEIALYGGYQQMYNLEFTNAHQTFLAYQQQHPNDPMGHVSNAAAYLFSEFDRLHILESDLFVSDQKFDGRSKQTPDPAVKAEFDKELAKSEEIAGKILSSDPGYENALFATVLANGLRGDYAALIEKRNIASLTYMKTSRTIAQNLLHRDPNCYDAYLAIGAENYLLGSSPAPVRWLLRLGGSETDKQEGLQRLRLTADKGYYLAPFARLLLAVAALRDKDRGTAKTLLAGLATQFPRNQLYARELARIQ